MMDFKTKRGILSFPVDRDGMAILRLLKHHSPLIELVGKNEHGGRFLVYLAEIELPGAETLPPNIERAQLAALGKAKA
jgi:hypothetical protein